MASAGLSFDEDSGADPSGRPGQSVALGSSPDAIISTDQHGVITSWNAGAETLYGYAASEIVGMPLSELVLPGEGPISDD